MKLVHSSVSYQQATCQNMIGGDVNRLVGMALYACYNSFRLAKNLTKCFIDDMADNGKDYCNEEHIKLLEGEVNGLLDMMGCPDDNYYGKGRRQNSLPLTTYFSQNVTEPSVTQSVIFADV